MPSSITEEDSQAEAGFRHAASCQHDVWQALHPSRICGVTRTEAFVNYAWYAAVMFQALCRPKHGPEVTWLYTKWLKPLKLLPAR